MDKRVFAHITLSNNKVVNIFDWNEAKNPDLGKQNLLLDITNRKDKAEIKIGDIYNGINFASPPELEPEKEKTIQEIKDEIVKLLQEVLEKVKLL